MSKILKDIKLQLDEDLAEKLAWLQPDHGPYRILRQSVDARRGRTPHFILTLEVAQKNENLPTIDHTPSKRTWSKTIPRPIVVGTGPGGLFAALRLAESGVPCELFERGGPAEVRIQKINQFWRYGKLDPNDNVCFGEGGAGLYSDGKLITRIKSPHIPYVLQKLSEFGAPQEIQYYANPHVGSDRIRRLIPKLRQRLIDLGCKIHFNTPMENLLVSSQNSLGTQAQQIQGVRTQNGTHHSSPFVVLAIGHSATDTLTTLAEQGVHMDGKSFAMGLRVEHSQNLINQIQYREQQGHPKLGTANYRLADHNPQSGIGVYSFCMCPGGYVLSSGTEKDGIVCNGMSNFRRNSPFANAAIVVSIDHEHNFGSDVWGGMKLRRELEHSAFQASLSGSTGKEIPAQRLTDFLEGRTSSTLPVGSSPSGICSSRLDQMLPKTLSQELKRGLTQFGNLMPGFLSSDAVLYGVESRTSCPVRITRDPNSLQSISHHGLYPCGEGAGYAGGITSAACDGVRIADKILKEL